MIMRDVNYGWLIRYAHANGASFFFLCVYLHIARGLYYGSFNKPRVELWAIGVTIFIVLLGLFGPICKIFIVLAELALHSLFILFTENKQPFFPPSQGSLPFITPHTKSINRIGPHNFYFISILISGLLGDWWGSIHSPSFRFYGPAPP